MYRLVNGLRKNNRNINKNFKQVECWFLIKDVSKPELVNSNFFAKRKR